MAKSIDQFKISIKEIKDLKATLDNLSPLLTAAIDLSDFYRSLIVQTVSAFDYFIHEFVAEEMLEIYKGNRGVTSHFNDYTIPLSSAIVGKPSDSFLLAHIRKKHSWLSFQEPDKVADAFRLITTKKVWEEVSPKFFLSSGDLKLKIKLIVDRRNKIAHESDMDPSYPGTKWAINSNDVSEIITFIEDLCDEIYIKLK